MKITATEGREIIYDDHEDWKTIDKKIESESRWSNNYRGVFQHIPTDNFYILRWSQGKTENQDEQPFEYEKPKLVLAEKTEQKIIKWIPIRGIMKT